MKQLEVKATKTINGNTFHIRAFPAMKATNIFGELVSFIAPIAGTLVPLAKGLTNSEEANILDIDAEKAVSVLAGGFSFISGDKVEKLIELLLFKHKCISVELEGANEAIMLTEELVNELFCGEAVDLYSLAFEVVRANFGNFITRADGQFGRLLKGLLNKEN